MAPTTASLSPIEVVVVLRSARGRDADPRLDALLGAFRRQWRALARQRYPSLGDEVDDAIQEAMTKLTDPERLASLRDPHRVEAWARSVFVHTVLDVLRGARARAEPRATPAGDDDGESIIDLLAAGTQGPEEIAAHQQRLRLVMACIGGIEVARLKFLEDLPENEIAARCNLTRDGVAGQLKRVRKRLRSVLEAADRIVEAPRRPAGGSRA